MREKILEILHEIQPDFDFSENVDFIESGYLDSFDIVQLIAALEAEFHVSISALDIVPENFGSCQAIEKLIQKSSK